MNKEFIPYEQALALKELGFDEPCFGYYNLFSYSNEFQFDIKIDENSINYIEAPLYQQAFRWFREKYDLVIEPCVPFQRLYSTEDDHFEILEFGYRIYSFDQYRGGLRNKIEWDGYDNSGKEEAELECLKKLIEIVKNK
jgi:hypothetical protein